MADGSQALFRGPLHGYASDAKQMYRDAVWGVLAKHAADEIRMDDRMFAVLLPSSNGLEIATAIAHGIPEHKIIAVDENPALIAASKWRKDYPSAKFYGCKISELAPKLIKDKRMVAAANLDLCNNFSAELLEEIASVTEFPRSDRMVFALTIAKGREGVALTWLLKETGKDNPVLDEPRMSCVMSRISGMPFMRLLAQGKYINNRYPMAWAAFQTNALDIGELDRYSAALRLAAEAVKEADDQRCAAKCAYYSNQIECPNAHRKAMDEYRAHMRGLNDRYRAVYGEYDSIRIRAPEPPNGAIFDESWRRSAWVEIVCNTDTGHALASISGIPSERRP